MRQAQLCFGLLPKLLYAYLLCGRPLNVLRPVWMRATFLSKRECATKQWSHFLFLHLFKKNCLNQGSWSYLVWCKNQKCNKTKQPCCFTCCVLFVCHVPKLSWLYAQIRSVTSVALSILWMTHTNRRCSLLIWFISCFSSPSICGHGPKKAVGGWVNKSSFTRPAQPYVHMNFWGVWYMCMDKTLNAQGMDANAGIFQMRHVFESTPGLRRRKVPVLCIDRISFGCSCEFVCLKNCFKKDAAQKSGFDSQGK